MSEWSNLAAYTTECSASVNAAWRCVTDDRIVNALEVGAFFFAALAFASRRVRNRFKTAFVSLRQKFAAESLEERHSRLLTEAQSLMPTDPLGAARIYRQLIDEGGDSVSGNLLFPYTQALIHAGRPKDAVSSLEALLEATQQANESEASAVLQLNLAICHRTIGDDVTAERLIRSATRLIAEKGSLDVRQKINAEAGAIAAKLMKFDLAKSYMEAAVKAAREAGDAVAVAGLLGDIAAFSVNEAQASGSMEKMQAAISPVDAAVTAAREVNVPALLAHSLYYKSRAMFFSNNLRRSLVAINEAITAAKEAGNMQLYASSLAGRGAVLFVTGERKSAIEDMLEAEQIAISIGNDELIQRVQQSLVDIGEREPQR